MIEHKNMLNTKNCITFKIHIRKGENIKKFFFSLTMVIIKLYINMILNLLIELCQLEDQALEFMDSIRDSAQVFQSIEWIKQIKYAQH